MKGKNRGTKVNGLKQAPLAVEISTYVRARAVILWRYRWPITLVKPLHGGQATLSDWLGYFIAVAQLLATCLRVLLLPSKKSSFSTMGSVGDPG